MVEIPDVKPNSNRYREQEKKENSEYKITKVTKGNVKKNQSSTIRKITKAFVPEDAKSIKDYVIEETPGLIQSFLRRLIQNILDTYLPENGKYSGFAGGLRSRNGRTRYDLASSSGSNSSVLKSRTTNSVYEYDEITFEFYEDAQNTLDGMYEWLSRCEKVSVFDLYDLAGYPTKATDRNYGWTDLRGAKIIAVKEGWVIDLPRAIPLY